MDATPDVVDRLENDETVAGLMAQGFTPTIEFGDYTDSTYGTPLASANADEAGATLLTPQQQQQLANQPIHLFFDGTPAWTVRFTVPASALASYYHGPASTNPMANDSSPATLFLVFSPDATKQLQLLTFPADAGAGTTTTSTANAGS